MSPVCPPEFLVFANLLADASGDVIRRHFRQPIPVDDKADSSPVTIADHEAEQAIRVLIESHRPDDGIIGEEFGEIRTDAEFVWVVDPIDGTKSFIVGRPIFGTLIALVQDGVPILGVIDQPIGGDRWTATADGISMLNGAPIRTRSCPNLETAIMATTSPHLFSEHEAARYGAVEQIAKYVVFGGDCYNYAMLAAGQIDLVVESGLKPFDFCALVPVIEQAGGLITDWRGGPVRLGSDGSIVAAGDPALHAAALKILAG